jgi:DNA-binding MarR family transcriptional regulator
MCILHILFRPEKAVNNYVYNAHMNKDIRDTHDALLDIIGFMNRPEPDVALMSEMSMPLERALLPLLVRVERRGPIGVVELADLVGRDYTTVSRQVARLDELGLVARRAGARDKRVREAEVTRAGREVVAVLDQTREVLVSELMADWTAAERRDLARLMKRFAGDMNAWVLRHKNADAGDEAE